MSTTVNIGGNSLGLQAAVDQAVASLRALALNLDELDAQSSSTGASMGVLGKIFTDSGFSLQGLLSTMGVSGGPIGAFLGLIGQVTGGISSMIEQALSFVTAMAGWAIIQQVISWVQQLSDELFNLQVQTQRMDVGWSYIFGAGGHAQGQAISRQLMQWSSQFSMNIPFTRQDLMSSITTLSTAGLNPTQIEQFMPYLSDIAATYGSAAYGGQGVNLQQASNAIRMASQGISRMLKYDLNITPEELVPYGLVGKASSTGFRITDPNSLFRALENFAKAKGVAGASSGIVGSTWWGGWSSLVDNFQNFLLQAGGTDLNGTVEQGSFFGTLQTKLDDLLKWFSTHQTEIKHFADIVSKLLGDATGSAGSELGQFVNWLDKLNAVSWLQNGLTGLDALILHPPTWLAQTLTDVQQFLSGLAGFSWSGAQSFFSGLAKDAPAIELWVGKLAGDMARFFTSMPPGERGQLMLLFQQIGEAFGNVTLGTLIVLDQTLNLAAQILPQILPTLTQMYGQALMIADVLNQWGANINNAVTALENFFNSMPPWMIDVLKATVTAGGWVSPGGSSGGSSGHAAPGGSVGHPLSGGSSSLGHHLNAPTNSTMTPGGYRTFGATGRSTGTH